jgi:hypothetical protein
VGIKEIMFKVEANLPSLALFGVEQQGRRERNVTY